MTPAQLAHLYRRASFLRAEFAGVRLIQHGPVRPGLADLMDRCAAVFASGVAGETLS